jgi:DNA polymerase-3 subunit delta
MDLEAQILAGELRPVYLLAGTDPLLYQRVVAALVSQVVDPATRAFNHDVFEGKGANAQAILGAARTLPMMAKRRLVVVRDVEGLGADGMAALAAYLDKPVPETVLVLWAQKTDGRIKLFQAAKKKGFLHELEVPKNLVGWILSEATRRRARINEDAARRLADVVGADLGRLSSSVEQLTLYAGERAVEAADVDELIAETRERSVFELTNAVGQGQREKALRAVARLMDQRESAIGVTVMLARHLRQVALAREHAQARTPRAELPRLIGAPPFAVDGLMQQGRRFSTRGLERAVTLLAQADLDLKGPKKAALGERILLERLVNDLCGLAAEVAPTSRR